MYECMCAYIHMHITYCVSPFSKTDWFLGTICYQPTTCPKSSRTLIWTRSKGHSTHDDWEPVTSTPQTLSLMEKAEPVQVRFTLHSRDQWSRWLQDGCKVYMDSYTASNGSCFLVTWIISKNHLLEVSLTQNRETMALRILTTADLYYFIMCEDPHE
jgi:hypothetical protein